MPDKPIERMGMYGWYDPSHILQTGIRVGIATIFGEFLDRRELFGNRDDVKPATLDPHHDYSKQADGTDRPAIWLDYIADTGDGWDPTYAVARLLARTNLFFWRIGDQWRTDPSAKDVDAANEPATSVATRRAEVLVMGGDQVYATASRDEYRRRLLVPFEQAAIAEGAERALEASDVYAIPGNHDWYDGLNSFMGLFSARRPGAAPEGFGGGRRIGYRLSKQTRSYFALKLPGNWWLLGVDAQLTGYLDRGQIAFFDDIAQKEMARGSNVILCAAMPSWSYVDLDGDADEIFRNYSYLEGVVTGTARSDATHPRRHNLRLVLTGDSHHYARYMEGTGQEAVGATSTTIAKDTRCYLTWGGGGAFLHPTHQLKSTSFDWRYAPPPPVTPIATAGDPATVRRTFTKKVVYPSAGHSRLLSLRVPLFAWNNPWFTALMFCFGLVMAWALAGVADLKGERLPDALRTAASTWDAVKQLFFLLVSFPWAVLTCVALVAALTYFSAAWHKALRWLTGLAHTCAYVVGFFAWFLYVARGIKLDAWPAWSPVLLVLIVAAGWAVIAPTIMGFYLWISSMVRRHWNEAFSSLRVKHHKGFLRLHVDQAGTVTVYPVAIDEVPRRGEGELAAKLIERPIRLVP